VVAVSREFEVHTHRVKTMELLNLRQTGSVEDYKNQFDKLVYHIMLYDHSLSETMLVSQFLIGLNEELRHSVEMHLPSTVAQAATLAAVQEHLLDKPKVYHRRYTAPRLDSKAAAVTTDLWKAKQLKEYRRAHNLCFKCEGQVYFCSYLCYSRWEPECVRSNCCGWRDFLVRGIVVSFGTTTIELHG
jgi:ribosomal protein L32